MLRMLLESRWQVKIDANEDGISPIAAALNVCAVIGSVGGAGSKPISWKETRHWACNLGGTAVKSSHSIGYGILFF